MSIDINTGKLSSEAASKVILYQPSLMMLIKERPDWGLGWRGHWACVTLACNMYLCMHGSMVSWHNFQNIASFECSIKVSF